METSAAKRNSALRMARERMGWSQEVLAERVGVSTLSIYRWERGDVVPHPHYRVKLAEALKTTDLGFVLHGKHDEAPHPAVMVPSPYAPLGTALVGRTRLLAELIQTVTVHQRGATLALYGLPGVGKTTLAVELAAAVDLRRVYPDGVLWGALGQGARLETVLRRWGTALGLDERVLNRVGSVDTLSRSVHDAIGMRKLVVVIDDVWRREDALVCMIGGPECVHILTTRFPALAVEMAHEQATLVPELAEDDGMTLLAELVPEMMNRPDIVSRLVRAVGGLPLALRLIGHYAQSQRIGGQTRRWHAALDHLLDPKQRLHLTEHVPPAHQATDQTAETPRSLQTVIALSVAALGIVEANALRALALFPAKPTSFSEAAALAAISMPEMDGLRALDLLADVGMVEGATDGRYAIHPTIVDYLRLDAPIAKAIPPVLTYYQHALLQQAANGAMWAQEGPTFLAVLGVAADYQLWSAIITALLPTMGEQMQHGFATELHLLLRRVVAEAPALSTDERVHLLLWRARVAEFLGFYDEAMRLAQEGAPLAEAQRREADLLNLLHIEAMTAGKKGDLVRQEQLLSKGIARARLASDTHSLLPWLGSLQSNRGQMPTAETTFSEGLQLATALEDAVNQNQFMSNLGVLLARQGRYAEAQRYFERGLTIARQLGNRRQMAFLLHCLGHVLFDQGDDAGAKTCLREGLVIARAINNPEVSYAVLSILAEVEASGKHYETATTLLAEALEIVRRLGKKVGIANVLNSYGDILCQQRRYMEAQQALDEALSIARSMGFQEPIVNILITLGKLALATQAHETAIAILTEAETLATMHNYQELQGLALYQLSRALFAMNMYEQAQERAQASLRLLTAAASRYVIEVQHWVDRCTPPTTPP